MNQAVLTLLLLIGTIFGANHDCAAQSEPAQTVIDYYFALPDEFLGDGYEKALNQRADYLKNENGNVVVRDEKNGYLQISGDGARPAATIAVFKKADGKPLIGVTLDWTSGDGWSFYVLQPNNGNWTDVTKSVVPRYETCESDYTGSCTIYELPRQGTTIIAKNKRGKRLFALKWNKTKFLLQK